MIRTTVRNAHEAIAARQEFNAGSMSARGGQPGEQYRGTSGRLPFEWNTTYMQDTADGLAYIVFSYGTPIGWESSDGTRVIPRVSYSRTTARHQYQLRSAWGHRWGQEYSNLSRGLESV